MDLKRYLTKTEKLINNIVELLQKERAGNYRGTGIRGIRR